MGEINNVLVSAYRMGRYRLEGDNVMIELDKLIEILEKSVKKNGEIVLTNQHLLNILRMAEEICLLLNDGLFSLDNEE